MTRALRVALPLCMNNHISSLWWSWHGNDWIISIEDDAVEPIDTWRENIYYSTQAQHSGLQCNECLLSYWYFQDWGLNHVSMEQIRLWGKVLCEAGHNMWLWGKYSSLLSAGAVQDHQLSMILRIIEIFAWLNGNDNQTIYLNKIFIMSWVGTDIVKSCVTCNPSTINTVNIASQHYIL